MEDILGDLSSLDFGLFVTDLMAKSDYDQRQVVNKSDQTTYAPELLGEGLAFAAKAAGEAYDAGKVAYNQFVDNTADEVIGLLLPRGNGRVSRPNVTNSAYAVSPGGARSMVSQYTFPPTFPLVGVEMNPGPNPQRRKMKKQPRKVARAAKNAPRIRASNTPAAFGFVMENPVQLAFSKPKGNGFGNGIRVTGRQAHLAIGSAGADTGLFLSSTATANSTTSSFISPDNLNGRLAAIADRWNKYAFRRVTIMYSPTVASTQAGAYTMGFSNDPALDGSTVTFAFATEAQNACIANVREPCMVTYTYDGPDTWYMKEKTSATADVRQTNQVVLVGAQAQSAAVTYGYTMIDYVVDLYEATGTAGISLSVDGRSTRVPRSRLDEVMAVIKRPASPIELIPVGVDMDERERQHLDPYDLGGGMHPMPAPPPTPASSDHVFVTKPTLRR